MASWINATIPIPPTGGIDRANGIITPQDIDRAFTLNRYTCDPRLSAYVETYWAVSWDLPEGVTHVSRVLSSPANHLSIEEGDSERYGMSLPAVLVYGVPTTSFTAELRGKGRVFGVRFRPGGFAALSGFSVEAFTDEVKPLRAFWDDEGALLSIVGDAFADRSLTRVEELASRHHQTVRGVQRLAKKYIGVSPKWLIRRFRLQDAVAALQENPECNLAELSIALGWSDQGHFSRDFGTAIGMTPRAYGRGMISHG